MKTRQATELDRLFARFDRARDERLNAGELRRSPAARPRAEPKPAQPRARARFVRFALLLGVLGLVLAAVLALLTRSRAARSA